MIPTPYGGTPWPVLLIVGALAVLLALASATNPEPPTVRVAGFLAILLGAGLLIGLPFVTGCPGGGSSTSAPAATTALPPAPDLCAQACANAARMGCAQAADTGCEELCQKVQTARLTDLHPACVAGAVNADSVRACGGGWCEDAGARP